MNNSDILYRCLSGDSLGTSFLKTISSFDFSSQSTLCCLLYHLGLFPDPGTSLDLHLLRQKSKEEVAEVIFDSYFDY